MNEILFIVLAAVIKVSAIVGLVLTLAAAEVWLERKVSAWIQNRLGPNRVGPFGLLQPFADVVKLFMKEDIVPAGAHFQFHRLAPFISLVVAISVYAVIPFAHYINIGDKIVYLGVAPELNVGVLYILAMTSVGVYGITLAGWSSNNKYSLLGGLRSAAQMISYELTMGLAVAAIVVITGSFSLNAIVLHQEYAWNILTQPLGFLLFLTASFAETNRAPFDLPEAEPELVGGFNTEYSGMKFGMFFLAEYANMATASAIIVLMYFGGWLLPGGVYEMMGLLPGSWQLALAQFLVFGAKVGVLIFFFVWVRWSIPRFRYDQLMYLGWKKLLPIAIINVLITSIVVVYWDQIISLF